MTKKGGVAFVVLFGMPCTLRRNHDVMKWVRRHCMDIIAGESKIVIVTETVHQELGVKL